MPQILVGTIVSIDCKGNGGDNKKKFGFIKSENVDDHMFFHEDFLKNNSEDLLCVGANVVFDSFPARQRGYKDTAKNIFFKNSSSDINSEEVVKSPVLEKTENKFAILTHVKSDIPIPIMTSFHGALRSIDPDEFEDSVFILLRLLDIHYIFPYSKRDQAGKSDGFFKIPGLVVVYDCTLNEKYLSGGWGDKTDQINNFVSVLKRGYIEFNQHFTMKAEFSDVQKQVWIITRGSTKIIKIIDGIFIKQIDVKDIVNLINKRFSLNPVYTEQDLATDLISIGKL